MREGDSNVTRKITGTRTKALWGLLSGKASLWKRRIPKMRKDKIVQERVRLARWQQHQTGLNGEKPVIKFDDDFDSGFQPKRARTPVARVFISWGRHHRSSLGSLDQCQHRLGSPFLTTAGIARATTSLPWIVVNIAIPGNHWRSNISITWHMDIA